MNFINKLLQLLNFSFKGYSLCKTYQILELKKINFENEIIEFGSNNYEESLIRFTKKKTHKIFFSNIF